MSTGAECALLQVGDEWYYVIQEWPYGEWPGYCAHGPFASRERALSHRRWFYANPGGYQVLTPESQGYAHYKEILDRNRRDNESSGGSG